MKASNQNKKLARDMIGLVQALNEAADAVDGVSSLGRYQLSQYIKKISERFEVIAKDLANA